MRAGIDCVAVTDHDSGEWIDQLKTALSEMEKEKPDGYQPLHVLPGAEISVQGGVHVLAVFSNEKETSDINRLLGAVGSKGPGSVTTASLVDTAKEIVDAGGIAIPAHADQDKGLFKATHGQTLEQILRYDGIFAMELRDADFEKPELYNSLNLNWTEILGSDSHHLAGRPKQRYPGSHFTWIKMGSPSLEGLSLALRDGDLSVRRSDRYPNSPNDDCASSILRSISVTGTKYMGRERTFNIDLNPWLNAIIGGRGTGKSSLIEFLRLALRRDNELPEALEQEFAKYAEVYKNRNDDGLLTKDAKIEVVYSKDGAQYRIGWSADGNAKAMEEVQPDGSWIPAKGDVRQRFPVRMYSQKQVLYLAMAPSALLDVVDEAPEVQRHAWDKRWKQQENNFMSLRLQKRRLRDEMREESKLSGDLADVERKLKIFEQRGHADVLRAYQRHRRQKQLVDRWESQWAKAGEHIRHVQADIVPDALDAFFVDAGAQADSSLVAPARIARERLINIRMQLGKSAEVADKTVAEWRNALDQTAWKNAADEAGDAYTSLKQELATAGVGGPSEYGLLVQRKHGLQQQLDELKRYARELANLKKKEEDSLTCLLETRRELTVARRAFLESVLHDSPYVRIQVRPFGQGDTIEAEFRRLIQKDDGRFEKDINDLVEPLKATLGSRNGSECIASALTSMKRRLHEIRDGTRQPRDSRFTAHLRTLPPEVLDRLDLWFPDDSLAVYYSPTGDGRPLRPIREGSPGQKTAALLAFLLSYGQEPLVLDQPEDDLDNQLIYELIVRQMRDKKKQRQIIVVTHNPSIVVNGDAELVVALASRAGQTTTDCKGSLQEAEVRDSVCRIMEGGLEAFKERYRRITVGGI